MITLRNARQTDIEAVAALYGDHVLNGAGTFEEQPPTPQEMQARWTAVCGLGLPYLVAEDGDVLGYAYASPYRLRAAYRHSVEDSLYVAPGAVGRGVGTALLQALIARCEALDLRQMIAVIGGADNLASIAVHRRCGFYDVGTAPALGHKQGRWLDVIFMQRALGPGQSTPPTTTGWPFS